MDGAEVPLRREGHDARSGHDGGRFGFIAFVIVRAAEGRWREVHPFMWAASAAFALYFVVAFLQDTFDWI